MTVAFRAPSRGHLKASINGARSACPLSKLFPDANTIVTMPRYIPQFIYKTNRLVGLHRLFAVLRLRLT